MTQLPIKPNDYKYVLLSGRFVAQEHLEIYERAYQFWFDNWTAVYKQLNVSKRPNPDDFIRQDFIPVILHGSRIIAIHLYTLYDLRAGATFEHSYLRGNFTPEYFQSLTSRGVKKVMSMEAMFVDAEYRKSKTGVQFSEVLACLGQKVFQHLTDADAIVAPARSDLKVSEIGYRIGFEATQAGIPLNNVTVDLITCFRDQGVPPPDAQSRLYVEQLWNQEVSARETSKAA